MVIVNQAFVDRYLEDQSDALGVRLNYGDFWGARPPEYEIVGVVEDVRFSGRAASAPSATYFPHAQQPVREMSLLVRTEIPLAELIPAIRRLVAEIDPRIPVDDVALLDELLADSLSSVRLTAWAVSALGIVALVLTAVGVYGVLSYLISLSSRELTIRRALGAGRRHIFWRLGRQGLQLSAIGLVVGTALSVKASTLLQRFLFQVSPADPVTYLLSVGMLLSICLIASFLPARALFRSPLASRLNRDSTG